jgi:hypothetical protein
MMQVTQKPTNIGKKASNKPVQSLKNLKAKPNSKPNNKALQAGLFALDTLGTNRSFEVWKKEINARWIVESQANEVIRELEQRKSYAESFWLNKAASTLKACGYNYLTQKVNGQHHYLHSFHCKKKYCPRCHTKKRQRLYAKFATFFESQEGTDLLDKYDVAILTVTLRHNEQIRQGWYFQELKKHFYNLLKYGAFKKYLAGGIYNTEITHSKKNGFHIHRHAVVMVPKQHNFRSGVVGNWWQDQKGSWKFQFTDKTVLNELQKAWLKKTGESFQLDIKPINQETGLLKNILEVFKYCGKPYKDQEGNKVLPAVIVEQLEKNGREKFTNRFGCLHRIKALAINSDQNVEANELIKEGGQIYIGTNPYVAAGQIDFLELQEIKGQHSLKEILNGFGITQRNVIQDNLLKLQNASFQRQYNKERLRSLAIPTNLRELTKPKETDAPPFALPY